MPTNKRGGKGYSKSPRVRKNDSFQVRYGMTRSEWTKFKKTSTKEEVVLKREKAKRLLK